MSRDLFNYDAEFRFNDVSNYEGHLHQNGILIWYGMETSILITIQVYMKIVIFFF